VKKEHKKKKEVEGKRGRMKAYDTMELLRTRKQEINV
jgi:hypothetical protein